MHPVARFVVALSSAATWAMLDVAAGRVAFSGRDPSLPAYTCGAMHPDGNFFAAGGTEGGVRLFDTRKAADPLAKIDGVEGAVRGLSFNENGYWAAVACDSGVQVRVPPPPYPPPPLFARAAYFTYVVGFGAWGPAASGRRCTVSV